MKTKKICAVLLACMVMASAFGAGCKKDSDASTSGTSDTGISLSIDPNVTGTTTADPSATTTAGASGDTTAATESSYYIKMTFEENYDTAAIAEMGKKCTVHGVSYKEFDFNFYYANEYVGVMSNVMANAEMMTQAGFVNLDYKISDTMTIRDYLRQTVETDLQGEAFLADYAAKNNITLPQETIDEIDSQIAHATESAQVYNMTLDEYLKSLYGPTANVEVLRSALQRYELANLAQKKYVEEYKFAEGEDQLPVVYHVLYMTIDKTTGAELTAEQQAEAKKKADDLLAAASTLDDLKTKGQAALDAGEAAEASQYTVELGQMVQEFEDWCFADHKEGDKAVVKTQFGYHVMYFVGTETANETQKSNIALYKMQDDLTAAINSGEYDVKYE
ncbi:MAG: peptidylprolyl isomerase [Clostridiales bacterium]|nr:peptidylprolyl isomerase [Clostridiales bacterium]